MKSLKTMLAVLVTATVGCILIGCSSDEWFGINNDSVTGTQTRAKTCNKLYSQHLDIKSSNSNEWTDEDYATLAEATIRMGLSFSKEQMRYVFSASSASEINISKKLYNLVKSQFEYTNTIINPQGRTFASRQKISSPEPSTGTQPNCVPMAISHMGQAAPSYSAAVAACDSLDAGWLQRGGVSSSKVGDIIRCFTPVTTVLSFDSYSSDREFNHCVMLINQGGTLDHAVNATKLVVTKNNNETTTRKVIYYIDYTKGDHNEKAVSPELITAIYPF